MKVRTGRNSKHTCASLDVFLKNALILLPEEGDDEDDPEYNFLAEIDEPDVEDYRNDKAVRITSEFIWEKWLADYLC